MSVADDGGSSGRLRRDLDVLPPGDLRKCLVALAGDGTVVGRARSSTASTPGTSRATRSATSSSSGSPRRSATRSRRSTRPAGCSARSGRVRPGDRRAVVLKADIEGERWRARSRCRTSAGRIRRVELVPRRRAAHPGRARRDRRGRPGRPRPGVAVHEPPAGALRPRDPRRARAHAGAGRPGLQPAAPGARDHRARRRRPPPGRPRPRGPGRRVPLRAGRQPGRRRGRIRGWGVRPGRRAAVARPDRLAHDPAQIGGGARRICCSPTAPRGSRSTGGA